MTVRRVLDVKVGLMWITAMRVEVHIDVGIYTGVLNLILRWAYSNEEWFNAKHLYRVVHSCAFDC